jgi:hypothetical protein
MGSPCCLYVCLCLHINFENNSPLFRKLGIKYVLLVPTPFGTFWYCSVIKNNMNISVSVNFNIQLSTYARHAFTS